MPALNDDILAFDPAEFTQLPEEGVVRCTRRSKGKISYSRCFCRLLPTPCCRPYRRRSEEREELTSLDCQSLPQCLHPSLGIIWLGSMRSNVRFGPAASCAPPADGAQTSHCNNFCLSRSRWTFPAEDFGRWSTIKTCVIGIPRVALQ